MDFSWDNWVVIFIGWSEKIHYIWDCEFYDTGIKETYVRIVRN